MDYIISFQEDPQAEVIEAIRSNLVTFNRLQIGIDNYKPLVLGLTQKLSQTFLTPCPLCLCGQSFCHCCVSPKYLP